MIIPKWIRPQSTVKQVLKHNPDARVVIKSTVPIGFTAELNQSNSPKNEIIFVQNFERVNQSKISLI